MTQSRVHGADSASAYQLAEKFVADLERVPRPLQTGKPKYGLELEAVSRCFELLLSQLSLLGLMVCLRFDRSPNPRRIPCAKFGLDLLSWHY